MRVPTISSPIRNRYFFASDLLLLPLAAYLSFVIRLESFNLEAMWSGFLVFSLLSIVIVPVVFARFGVYKRFWRYASLDELMLLGATITGANLLLGTIALIVVEFAPPINLPRSVPVIFLFLSLAVTTGPRLVSRLLWRADVLRRKTKREASLNGARSNVLRALIVGAGSGGSLMLRELRENPRSRLRLSALSTTTR